MTRPDLLRDPNRFLAAVEGCIAAGEPILVDVPGGRLHIDRPLPFLCVYRQPAGAVEGAAALVHAQGSYLVVDASEELQGPLTRLVRGIVKALADQFGSVLLLEIWTEPSADASRPTYRILLPDDDRPATMDVLAKALKDVDPEARTPEVAVAPGAPVAPSGLPALLLPAEVRKLGCLHLGLAVPRIFADPTSGALYPLLFRSLQRELGRAIRKALFAFTQLQTTFPVEDYRALGRRVLGDTVGDADRRLSELAAQLDFLLAVSPVNTEQAWEDFAAASYQRDPVFHYRPLAVDPDLYRRSLYELRLEEVEDPTVAALLRAKRRELDQRVTMLEERGTTRFLLTSLQEYGEASDELLATARALLDRLDPEDRASERGERLSAAEFAAMARAEMARYRALHPECHAQVRVRDDVPGVMVVAGDLLIGGGYRLPRERAEALLQHEVGTHVVTEVNGRAQPLRLLAVGLPGYEETQEGLAVLAEYLGGGLTNARLALLAARVLAVRCVADGASFVETFRTLHRDVGLTSTRAFGVAMRVHRSGGLTKDAMYLRGLDAVLRHLAEGGQLEPLLVGKLALEDVPVVEELQWRRVLEPAPLRPRWLDDPANRARLESIREGMTVLDLAEGNTR